MSKILCTIGPISQKYENLKKVLNFTNFVRLNGAHNTIEWHKNMSKLIKKINSKCKILIDLPGIKPRSNNERNILIKKNSKVIFYYGKLNLKKINGFIKIPLTKPIPYFKTINYFTVTDGKFNFKYISHKKNFIIGKSLQNFELLPKKGLNIPGSIYSDKLQEKVYINYLNKIRSLDIDAIGLSYVQNSKIIKKIKKKLLK